ncbi:MAG: AEC family transporter [Deltaproteobacteria bacterium]|nr:AEC family transporter [Deltaproteobacteria bacterium]
MTLFSQIIHIVFPIFSIIALGYFFAFFKKIDLKPVVEILLYITIPALVISSLSQREIIVSDLINISIVTCSVIFGVGGISWLYLRVTGAKKLRGFYLPTIFMNAGNIPFPLALLAFGAEGLQVAVLYYITASILVYTLGILIAKGRSGLSEVFKLPLVYCSFIGIGLNLADISIPSSILTTLDMLGAATIPLMQLSLGYYLYAIKITKIRMTIAGSLIRILGGFLIGLGVATLLGLNGVTLKVVIISSMMPSAVITFILSYKYDLDSELVASIVAMSTLISIISIPLVLAWLL